MFSFFLIVFLVPLACAGLAFALLDGLTLKGLLVIAVSTLVVAGSSALITSCANTYDVEVWNGSVVDKKQVMVPCSHSYPCNCRQSCTGSGQNQSCMTVCDTCYDHSHDYDWDVHTTNAETITIDRVDRQGVREPARFRSVVMGEPTAVTHSYKNYVKGSPDSLFRHQGLKEKYAASLPAYPQGVYDYYRLDRLVMQGVALPNPRAWNADLTRINATLGRSKQVNIVLVVVDNKPHDWYYALEESWIGGKKNDAVLVVSVDAALKPQWAEVMAWTTNELFKVKLRDDVMDLPKVDRDQLMVRVMSAVESYYVRKPMKDFEYLSSQIKPSGLQWSLTLIIALLVAGGLTWFFQVNDVFNERGYGYRRRAY